jgi:diguanylate cyclase (GGDEF)-like protein
VVTASDSLLVEQYITLRRQIPLMYTLMFINVIFLGIATFQDVPLGMSFGVPAALSIAIVARTVLWLRRRSFVPQPSQMRRYLQGTVITAAVLSVMFGGWGVLLFSSEDPIRSVSIALYVFVGAISCCYCLQALPLAGHFVLLFGGLPVTIRLLFSGNWALFSVGANFLIVAVLITRTLSTSFASFKNVLDSRSAMIAEQERARTAERQAQELAYHDTLTGLRNRRAISEHLSSLASDQQNSTNLALLILDLDQFKSVNDVHGHPAGDRLLQAVAERLKDVVGNAGEVYRLGGDEFAVTLPFDTEHDGVVLALARRIVHEMSTPFEIEGLTHHIGASVGVACFPHDATDSAALLRLADIALYNAKALGRSCHSAFDPSMDAIIKKRASLELEIRADLPHRAFVPFYQPIVDVVTGHLTGFEMLARWARKDGALVGPDQFIPIAEECGLIGEMMLDLLDQVCADAADWPAVITVAVNISPVQLRDPWLAERVLAVLTRRNFPTQRLSVEITENALISEPTRAKKIVASLKNLGMQVALDDFGTGYSSIQHLRMLPFDKIKIDRSFIRNMDKEAEAHRMVAAILQLAAALNLSVVAEGVEDDAVLELLKALGCREAQGFLFGHPVSGSEITQMLRDQSVPSKELAAR